MDSRKYYLNKTILVTGAAHGLGKSLVIALAKQGANLILVDKDAKALRETVQQTMLITQKCHSHIQDISNYCEMKKMATTLEGQIKHLDILFNNAGVSHNGSVGEMDPRDFEWVIRTNLIGTYHCVKVFLPLLKKAPNSQIVIVNSGIAFFGLPRFSAYASSKAGLRAFGQSLAVELSSLGIKVSSIYPGPIRTGIPLRSRHTSPEAKRKEISFLQSKGYDPEKLVPALLEKVAKRKEQIYLGWEVKAGVLFNRLCPGIMSLLLKKFSEKLPI